MSPFFAIVIDMKKSPILLILVVMVLIGAITFFFISSKKTINTGSSVESGECDQFSNKDGYTGCMSIANGKEKKCRFKVDNKVNEATQQMEFTYTCSPK